MKIRYITVFFMALLVLVTATGQAGQSGAALSAKQLQAAPELGRKWAATVSHQEQALLANAQDYLVTSRLHRQMAEQMTPENLIPLFVRELRKQSAWGAKPQRMQEFFSGLHSAHIAAANGGIKGQVTIAGAVAAVDVMVLAFDEHGYFVAEADVDVTDGSYTLPNLAAGSYYVMTLSDSYVDEIYDNLSAPLSDRSQWRTATAVVVADDAMTENINFDLQTCAVVQGRILDSDGVAPIAAETARLVLVNAVTGRPVMEREVDLTDGHYRLLVPVSGSFKIMAHVPEYARTWHQQAADISTALTVVIANLSDVVQNVDFVMQAGPAPVPSGAIAGSIKGKGQFFGALAGIVFVFDAQDTSLVKLGFGLLGGYSVENLPAGDYFVFGDDYFGNFMEGFGNFVGEFYEDAYSVKQAKKVTVTADNVTEDIDFILEPGGTVSGRIVSESGAVLDSLMVIAVDPSVLQENSEPFPSNLHVAACVTDANGKYKMQGLPAGAFMIRTFSNLTLSIILESPFIKIDTGKHNNKIVDAWYQDVPSLLDLKKAVPVVVKPGTETKNINMTLQTAKFITGQITDNQSGVALSDVMLFALEDSSNTPFPAFGQSNEEGAYRLGPLPNGNYKVLALAGDDVHLSEYFDGARDVNAAQALTVNNGNVGPVNFTLDSGAIIRGFIDLAAGAPVHYAGADTLEGFPVLVFNADNGELAGCDFVQFNGGFRVNQLLPGRYKVVALPVAAPFAATYYGGGAAFDDDNSMVVPLDYGTVTDASIELAQASGVISGKIIAADTQKPLTHALAIAYDLTGHPVGVGMADADVYNTTPSGSDGLYQIKGLRKGDYYVRTVALSANLSVVENLIAMATDMLAGGALDNPLALLNGDIFSQLNLDFLLYQDQWHVELPVTEQFNLNDLVFKLASSGLAGEYDNALFPVFLPLPYYCRPPKSATSIAVADGAAVHGIDFKLNPMDYNEEPTGVAESKNMPGGFRVFANYPNPFNPETTLSFSLDRPMQVSVTIYDALGRQLLQIANRNYNAGEHQLRWNGRDANGHSAASGLYLAVIRSGAQSHTVKMVLMK